VNAVVLAAGRGRRLKPFTDNVPKPLLKFKGRPLIDHVISALREAGVERVLVVTGYMGDAVARHLHATYVDVEVVPNPRWERGNAASLLVAKGRLAGGDFVLSMCDHIYSGEMVSDALAAYTGEPTLCIDRAPRLLQDLGDATKVLVTRDGYVKAIGKGLRMWNAVDTGVFILPESVFDVGGETYGELSEFMDALSEEGMLRAFDATGNPWVDLDTVDDLENALEAVQWI